MYREKNGTVEKDIESTKIILFFTFQYTQNLNQMLEFMPIFSVKLFIEFNQ